MKVERAELSPQEVRDREEAWYESQIALSAKALGNSWPEHREWVEANLKEELRQRLLALGWRPKR